MRFEFDNKAKKNNTKEILIKSSKLYFLFFGQNIIGTKKRIGNINMWNTKSKLSPINVIKQ